MGKEASLGVRGTVYELCELMLPVEDCSVFKDGGREDDSEPRFDPWLRAVVGLGKLPSGDCTVFPCMFLGSNQDMPVFVESPYIR